jgi:uncharacterized protein
MRSHRRRTGRLLLRGKGGRLGQACPGEFSSTCKMPGMELEERLRQVVASWPEIRLAVLFGSTARGESRPSSDVDIGLILDPYSASVRFGVDAQLGHAAGREVDTVLLDSVSPLLRFEVARDGVLLFEREEGLWTTFQVKAMVDWWDWAPTARKIQRAIIQDLRRQVERGQT